MTRTFHIHYYEAGGLDVDLSYARQYTTRYIITSDDQLPFGPIQARVIAADFGIFPGCHYVNDLPDANGDTEFDLLAYCTNLSFRPQAGAEQYPHTWICEAQYGPWNPNLIQQNPLDVYPVATYTTTKTTRPIDYDLNGNAIVNSAGDLYDPTVEVDDSRIMLNIKRNEASFDARQAAMFKDTINLNSFAGFDAGFVKVDDIVATPTWSSEIGLFFEVVYAFNITNYPEGWRKKVLDAGYKQRDSTGELVPIILKDGTVASSICLLDGAGNRLDPPPPDGTPVWNYYDVYPAIDFDSAFGFDASNTIGL